MLLDSGVPGSEEAILGAIAEAGHEPPSLTTMLLTHAHLHHSGSAAAVREATGAGILLSKPDAAFTSFPAQGVGIALVGEDLDVSARTAAELCAREFEVAVFGHGDPVVGDAARVLRDALA